MSALSTARPPREQYLPSDTKRSAVVLLVRVPGGEKGTTRPTRPEHRGFRPGPVVKDADHFHEQPVPDVLTELVRYHSYKISRYLYFAMDEGRWQEDFAEWQAQTLYKLTDALSHLQLLIGTLAAYLREEGVGPYFLRRYLQVNDDSQVEAYVTRSVQEHLAGLTGRPAPEGSVIWHEVGSGIANRTGWSHPETHEALEAALNAVFGNYPDDSEAFDHLPSALQDRILALIPLVRATGSALPETAD